MYIFDDGNVLYNDDNRVILNKLQEEKVKVDCIITSPPYNTSLRMGRSDTYNKRYDMYDDYIDNKEYVDFMIDIFNSLDKVLIENGTILFNMSYGTETVESATAIWDTIYHINHNTKFVVVDTIAWEKSRALPNNVSPNKLTRIIEYVFVIVRKQEFKTFTSNKKIASISSKGQKFYTTTTNHIKAKNNDGRNHLNSATFSTDLVRQLLELYVPKGKLVMDIFNGTGTTCNACKLYGYKFIGIELSKEQHLFAVDRLKETYRLMENRKLHN